MKSTTMTVDELLGRTRRVRREILTPDGVPLSVDLAGPAERFVALIVDLFFTLMATALIEFLALLSAVLTLETVGDHLRSGGSIISVMPDNPRPGSAESAVKAALSSWVAGQATIFGTRGITVNAVAAGRSAQPGYEGLPSTPPSVAAEVARMSLFLTSGAARHITGQTLHVSHGALAQFA